MSFDSTYADSNLVFITYELCNLGQNTSFLLASVSPVGKGNHEFKWSIRIGYNVLKVAQREVDGLSSYHYCHYYLFCVWI